MILYNETYDIYCFTETWLCANFTDGMLDPRSQFNIYRKDRQSQWPAGGVCIFINKSIQSCLNTADGYQFHDTEIVAANVHLSAKFHISIICAYLPPNLSHDLYHRSILHINDICSQGGSIILLGDFNLPSINWSDMISGHDTKSVEFFDLCSDHGFSQLVVEPTRRGNILDLVLCNDYTLISGVEVSVPFGTSDHNSVSFSIVSACRPKGLCPDPAPAFNWPKTDWKAFAEYCQAINWFETLSKNVSADELWCAFTAEITAGIKMFVPIVLPRKYGKQKTKKIKTR